MRCYFGDTPLEAIVADGDAVESDYVEAKSDIDITTTLGLAKVAKFILGASNRDPARAQQHFRGHALLVIGAQRDEASGVPVGTEAHELQDKLARYLGRPGPTFALDRVSVSEAREVLFVIVDPPGAGQLGFPCHRDFQPDDRKDRKHALADGAIYVRGMSDTRQAKAADVIQLFERARAAPTVPIDLDIQPSPAPARMTDLDDFRVRYIDLGYPRVPS